MHEHRSERPRVPRLEELRDETQRGMIHLATADEMLARLRKLDLPQHAHENFFPLLLKLAGCQSTATEVPEIIVQAIDTYAKVNPAIRDRLNNMLWQLVDVMVTDLDARKKAKDFYDESANLHAH